MPNHAANILTIAGPSADVNSFINLVKTKEKNFDFNQAFPIPDELKNTVSPTIIMTQEQIDDEKKKFESLTDDQKLWNPSPRGITQETSDALKLKYGHDNWYSWKLDNWGTKWGAYDEGEWEFSDEEDDQSVAKIFYNTAWSPASAFLANVSKNFPRLTFSHIFSDEEGGASFVGTETFVNGDVNSFEPDWDSPEGIAFRDELGTNSFEDDGETS
jgi:hypothetical protein